MIQVLDDAHLGAVAGGAMRVPLDIYLNVVKGGGVQNGGPPAGGRRTVVLPPSANRFLNLVRWGVADILRDHRASRP